MKSLKYIFLSSLLAVGLSSCLNDDGYSLGDWWEGIGTINYLDEGLNTYDITLDDGTRMWVAASQIPNYKPKYKRAIFSFTILQDSTQANLKGYNYYVKLNAMQEITTKNVIYMQPQKEDSIGNDPVKLVSLWNAAGYMNFRIEYDAAGMYDHMVNLISKNENLGINKDTVELEFRHNRKNDPEYRRVHSIVSFNLAPYRVASRDSVVFKVKVNDTGKEKVYYNNYKYR